MIRLTLTRIAIDLVSSTWRIFTTFTKIGSMALFQEFESHSNVFANFMQKYYSKKLEKIIS
jgi:hypothetical protein